MKTYIVGNWKMNFTIGESSLYLHKLLKQIKPTRGLEIAISPSLIALQPLSMQLQRTKSQIRLAAQNFCQKEYGPYTGEVSITQIRELVKYALVGHSERRYVFHETDKIFRAKVSAAVRNGVTPILCIGETDNERVFGETTDVIRDQLIGGLSDISKEDLKKVIIAYEPVWAINNSKTARLASPDDVAQVIQVIRDQLKSLYSQAATADTPILYGGSVSPNNAGAYLTVPGVNGLLIGSASLISSQFLGIIDIAKRVRA